MLLDITTTMAKATKISIEKVGLIALAVIAFLLIAYSFTPSAEKYENWIKVNDTDWFEQCSNHPGGKQHSTQWGEPVFYGWEKNKSCVSKGGSHSTHPPPPQHRTEPPIRSTRPPPPQRRTQPPPPRRTQPPNRSPPTQPPPRSNKPWWEM